MNRKPTNPVRIASALLVLMTIGGLKAAPADAASALRPPAAIIGRVPSPFAVTSVQAANTFVGELQGNPSGLAAIISGKQILFYWCDGKAPGDWFGGINDKGNLSGSSAKGITITAKLAGVRIDGTLKRNGKTFKFRLNPTSAETGVFRAENPFGSKPGSVVGWIVLPKALVGATNEADGSVSDAVPLSGGRKIGGGCLKRRIALRLASSNGNSIDGNITMQDAGTAAGCDMTGVNVGIN